MIRIATTLLLFLFSASPIFTQKLADLPIHIGQEELLQKTDWLLDASLYQAKISRSKDSKSLFLHNGLISREIRLTPNAATVAFDNLITGQSIIRGVKPEGEITIDSKHYDIGGLIGQTNYAFLRENVIDDLRTDSSALIFKTLHIDKVIPAMQWKQVRYAKNTSFPPKGVHIKMDYGVPNYSGVTVSIHYELYDEIPVLCKWMSVQNENTKSIVVNKFTNELLAAVEYESKVEERGSNFRLPNIHVETDYAFGGMTVESSGVKSVHWEIDPQYNSQVNYLKNTPCLLKTYPELGPEQTVLPTTTFESFRTYVLPFDSYDRERNGLAQRRMYRKIAPWTTENPLMMHVRFADWESVKSAIDQCAAVGFEMVILTFGSGFNMEDDSDEYLEKMKIYADYAKSKNVEIGGYSLLASRSISPKDDVIMPEGKKATFGNSPCLESEWGQAYFKKLYNFYEKTGFQLLEHDGNYPGDECLSIEHPGHKGELDSRWNQWKTITDFYRWCRSEGIYLNVPDYYYLSGSNKCAMGYREVNWSLPRNEQVLHTRQNIYDGTWTKLSSMGWMFVPLTEYHGGGEAATIEPLKDHQNHYESMLMSNLAAGVQACYRGPRLYDTEATQQLVSRAVQWYKKHREVLEGDLIHLRRPDGRDIDYWMTVNPNGIEKGLLTVFNPLNHAVKKTINIPLYYTGLTDQVKVVSENHKFELMQLKRDYSIDLEIVVPANQWVSFVFEEG